MGPRYSANSKGVRAPASRAGGENAVEPASKRGRAVPGEGHEAREDGAVPRTLRGARENLNIMRRAVEARLDLRTIYLHTCIYIRCYPRWMSRYVAPGASRFRSPVELRRPVEPTTARGRYLGNERPRQQ